MRYGVQVKTEAGEPTETVIVHIERRKGTDVPFMAHLLGVASLVMGEAGHTGLTRFAWVSRSRDRSTEYRQLN